MNNPIEMETEMKDLNQENFFTTPSKADFDEGTSASLNDPDMKLGVIVLLLACLALAALAHVVV